MKQKTALRVTAAAAACSLFLGTGCFFTRPDSPASFRVQAAEIPVSDFSLGDVTMTDAYCVNAFQKEIEYLLSFDTDRLLCGFRENAGLGTNGASRYKGWEDTLIAGHTIGHYLTALAQASLNPSLTAAQKSGISAKLEALLSGMRTCQQNSKGKPGFLWAGQVKNRNNVEFQFDCVQQGKTDIFNEAWVPWYTMHKLIQGLVDVCRATGSATAKAIASDLGDWTLNRCRTWDQRTHNTVLSIEYGGMNDCLYELYLITGKDEHAEAAHYFDETNLHEAVLKGGANVLNGKHANTTIPKFIGALKRYIALDGRTVGGQKIDASRYLAYAEAFFDMVVTHHTYITGGNSEWEHFGMDDILDKERTNCNCETCNSYNMLKLSRELFKITGDRKYMDFYERTYYNSILSSQNPESGMTTYFQPMSTGYFKVYSSPYDSFWCCTGSGMESFTKLGDTIYMHGGNTLYVNLYQSSVLDWKEQNVKITQESSIPAGDTVTFTVSGSADLDLRFRIPDWKAGAVSITVNGSAADYETVSDYAQIRRSFSDGDVVKLTIPEKVTAQNLPDNQSVYGFRYGPVVLSAELGKQNMATGSTGMWVTIPKEAVAPSQNITIAKEGQSVSSFMREISDHMVRDGDSLRFMLKDTNTDLTFTPHYLQYQQRYGIYWNFLSNGTVVEEKPPRAKVTVTDTVQPGYGQYEKDEPHNMTAWRTMGVTDDSTYRYAEAGGYFSYQMRVDRTAPMTQLSVRLRTADNGKTLRVRVGDTVLFAGTLDHAGTESTYEMRLPVPADVLRRCVKTASADGRSCEVIDVTFSADAYAESAKVCDFIYMRAVEPDYEFDSSVAYFVDCGDHNTATVSSGEKLGLFNCLTEQLSGADEVSGMVWGLIDDARDQYNGASKSGGLYTANTWPNENATADGQAKTSSFRYTKNQYENGIARRLDYGFALPDGEYTVETSFSDPWSCSKNPSLYAECGGASETLIAENCPTDGTAVRGTVRVQGGQLTLHFRSEDKAINVNYIRISFADKNARYSTAGKRGDVNLDGVCDAKDAETLAKALTAGTELTWEQAYAADVLTDFALDARDLTLVKRIAG
ncbi:MAG: glycoside hydrolase family 127 protein [Oscillospiraceae bacterium]|nr:glycoside hydrolase family 127 protein [Oscillospiraceae bacterium]